VRGTGVRPAALEAGSVVGQHALDGDPVTLVEAHELGEEGDRAVGGLIREDTRQAEPGVVVDRDEEVLPADPSCALGAIAGHAVSGYRDAPELLHIDVHELTGLRALVADDLLASWTRHESRAAVPTEHCVHGRGSDPERPANHVWALVKLLACAQDRLLERCRCAPG